MVQRGIEPPPTLTSDIQEKIPRQKRERKDTIKETKEKKPPLIPKPRRHRKDSQIYPLVKDFGKDPLMDIRLNTKPWLLCINTKSPIYSYKMKVKTDKEWLYHNAEQMGLIRMKVAEKYGKLSSGGGQSSCSSTTVPTSGGLTLSSNTVSKSGACP